ncbi:MAG: DUF4416 family protein [bacterium]
MTLVKPIVGILTSQRHLLGSVLAYMAERFGPADVIGPWREFNHTRYYEDEMGPGLWRCFVSFSRLVSAEEASSFKGLAMDIEGRFSVDGRRAVNIDPGYIDSCKLVLVSGKHGGHKIALAPGAFADLLLWYDKGWKAMPWAFPDFRDGGYFPIFIKMRSEFKKQFKNANSPDSSTCC